MKFYISPQSVFKKLIYFIGFLLLGNILSFTARLTIGSDNISGLIFHWLDFNIEQNIPTFYSSVALLFASLLLWFIGFSHFKLKETFLPWFGLAFIFLYLSFDEIVSIHERLKPVSKKLLDAFNLPSFGVPIWAIPYLISLIILIFLYARFLLQLSKKIKTLFVISGIVFISGAVGFEKLQGMAVQENAQSFYEASHNLPFALAYTCEEFLEMLGVAIFIYALLIYISKKFGSLTIYLKQ